ncbi:Ras GTPase, partial [Mortierella sp. AD011]
MTQKTKEHNWRIILEHNIVALGRERIGITGLIRRFIYSYDLDDPTIEDSWRKLCVIDGKEAILDILRPLNWGGSSSDVKDMYIHNREGFMFVYSTASRKSFDEISSLYQEVLQIKGDLPICAIIVATYSDLHQARQVSTQEGRELAKRLHCQFIETSVNDVD